jgi:hypothetical protein
MPRRCQASSTPHRDLRNRWCHPPGGGQADHHAIVLRMTAVAGDERHGVPPE